MIGMTNEDTQESDDTWRSLGGLASGILNRILDQQVQRLAALEEVASGSEKIRRRPFQSSRRPNPGEADVQSPIARDRNPTTTRDAAKSGLRLPLVLRTGVRAGALRRREGKGSAVVT
jgi:hypothetical protein